VLTLEDPYAVVYRQIHAVASPDDEEVEILERSSCFGAGPGPSTTTPKAPW